MMPTAQMTEFDSDPHLTEEFRQHVLDGSRQVLLSSAMPEQSKIDPIT